MYAVGVVEVVAGIVVALAPRFGGLLVAVWLAGIVLNLLTIPGFYDTPRRVASSYVELLTPREFDLTTFPNDDGYDELVLAKSIPVQSPCEHHLLPFRGIAHVGYLPGARILGLAKLARVVELFVCDLQVQERLTKQVADWLDGCCARTRARGRSSSRSPAWSRETAMTRAFVLSGGGNLGAVQVGMLAALAERGIAADLLVGTSVGALNAAYLAGHGPSAETLDELTRLWRRVRRRDVFPIDPVRQLLALAGRRPSLSSNQGLRRLIADTLTYRRLENATVPIHVTATNVLTGDAVCLGRGDAVTAVLASAAVPAVFPAVEIDGLVLVDGGVADNAGISRAVALGADEVWVLPAGYACALTRPPAGALAAALHAVSLLTHQRLLWEVADLAARVDLHVLPPLCPVSVSPIDFSHSADLIERAHRTTRAWLADGGDRLPAPQRFLALHDHHRPDPMAGGCPTPAVPASPRRPAA